jgi:hypothetical protein
MDIVLKEVERRPRASLVEIKINSVGSSVGSSFFILPATGSNARSLPLHCQTRRAAEAESDAGGFSE